MDAQQEQDRIISEIYLAGAGMRAWSVPLRRLADLTGSQNSTLCGASLRTTPAAPVFMYDEGRIPPEAFPIYNEFMGEYGCMRWEYAVPLYDRGQLGYMCDFDYIEERQMSRHPYYEDVLRISGLRFAGCELLPRRKDVAISLTLQRTAQQGPVDQTNAKILQRMAQHVDKALGIQTFLGRQPLQNADEYRAFLLPENASLLRRDGLVLTVGAGFESGLIDTGLCQLKGNRLSGRSAELEKQIHLALGCAAEGAVQSIGLPRRGVRLVFVPMVREEGLNLPAPTVALFMEPIEEQRDGPLEIAALQHGFTAAERQICELLCAGDSVQEIAEQRSVSVWTVRTQLKSIFRKANVKSQSNLIAKLNRMVH